MKIGGVGAKLPGGAEKVVNRWCFRRQKGMVLQGNVPWRQKRDGGYRFSLGPVFLVSQVDR